MNCLKRFYYRLLFGQRKTQPPSQAMVNQLALANLLNIQPFGISIKGVSFRAYDDKVLMVDLEISYAGRVNKIFIDVYIGDFKYRQDILNGNYQPVIEQAVGERIAEVLNDFGNF